MREMGTEERRGLLLGLAVAGIVALAVLGTLLAGAPSDLPSPALESEVVLHVERAAIIAWALLALLTVADRARGGELPVEFSTTSARYADIAAIAEKSEAALLALRQQVDHQAKLIEMIVASLDGEAGKASGGTVE